ncbi:MAG: heat-inducible transcriptional repressor HrcA [Cyanobacteriota bacterium]|nr:heat-inducible transcriptional repressor HrcA [Cyanobacteriota bacterium]
MKHTLTPRQQKILWATVRSYIATAEPVGSRSLAENFDLGVSTATIRNDLALLEQGGLLFQPHTSAGRVPSDSGYRVYVNGVLRSIALGEGSTANPHRLQQELALQLGEHWGEDLDSLLRRAAQILASLSGCMALITPPQAEGVAIRHLQLLRLEGQRVMVVVVTDSYQTHSIGVSLSDGETEGSPSHSRPMQGELADEELQVLNNFLNLKLRGKTFAQLQDLSWLDLDREWRAYAQWLRQLLKTIARKCLKPSLGSLFSAGMVELMRQPEFAQTQQVEAVAQLLETNQEALGEVLSPHQPGQVVVYIGTENPLEPIRHCTLIGTTYHRGEAPLGSISLLGPTRMLYEQAIASVQALAGYLSNALA